LNKVTMSSVARTKIEMTGAPFVGTQSWRQPILYPEDSDNFTFNIVAFDAGTRTKSHTHSCDQILIITEGTGVVANDNESLIVSEGDVIVIPAGDNHWHGAPDATPMAHINVMLKGAQNQITED